MRVSLDVTQTDWYVLKDAQALAVAAAEHRAYYALNRSLTTLLVPWMSQHSQASRCRHSTSQTSPPICPARNRNNRRGYSYFRSVDGARGLGKRDYVCVYAPRGELRTTCSPARLIYRESSLAVHSRAADC